MSLPERAAALGAVPILAGLSRAALAGLAADCKWRHCVPDEQIVGYREATTDVLFLVAGKVRVIIHSADGRAVVFTDLGAPAMFGEIAAIDRGARSAGIEALGPCTLACLTADQFEGLLLAEPSVALATLRHVAAEVRRLSERVFEFSTLAVQSRIHAELLRLAAESGARQGQALLSPAPSLADIACRISTHREAVSRELSRLASLGVLQREGGDLRISDVARLERFVREAKSE